MATNIGMYGTTNFAKSKTFDYATGVVDVTTPGTSVDLNPEVIAKEVLKTIASLDKDQSEVNLETDPNPLDNIIRNEVIALFKYRKLSQSDIKDALDLYAQGQDASQNMSVEQSIILLTQARDLEYITEAEYLSLSSAPGTFWFNNNAAYLKVLNFQLSLPSTIPTIDELKIAGIVEFILTTVRANPEAVIDENLVRKYTEDYINNILLSSEFIGYDKAQQIYADPKFLMQILDKTTLKYFLYRVKPYLNFITDANIATIMEWLPSQYINIETIFSATQIRLMVDKELDIKNLILKTLTLDEVQKKFNELAAQFKKDFTEAFTNEKLMELIELTINKMYPELTLVQIYQNLATTFNTTISDEKIAAIENYLTNY